jgi:hypothetical protein
VEGTRQLGGGRSASVVGVVLLVLAALALGARPAAAAEPVAWTDAALVSQYELAGDVPLRNTPWVSTHNSYNSVAEMGPALAALDPNQSLTITEQLDAGVRHLEIDVHHALAPAPIPGLGATTCHTVCTLEKPFATIMGEVAVWLRAHPGQVLLLYVESHLEDPQGSAAYDEAAAVLGAAFRGLIHRPPGGGRRCAPLPTELTRDGLRAAGEQVLVFGPCGQGTAWPSYVFDETDRLTGDDNAALREAPDCGPEFTRQRYEAFPVRYYEDRTQIGALTGAADPIGPELTRRMTSCGVDIIGFDQLLRDDPRREALVWSWAPGQPRSGACAIQRADGRWESRACDERHRVACRAADGSWSVSSGAETAARAGLGCRRPGAVNGVPRTGHDGFVLQRAAAAAGAGEVWLGYARRPGGWVREERADCTPTLAGPERRWPVRDGVARLRVRLRLACVGETVRRSVRIAGVGRTVRGRSERLLRVPVRPGTTSVRARFVDRGRAGTVVVRLARR